MDKLAIKMAGILLFSPIGQWSDVGLVQAVPEEIVW